MKILMRLVFLSTLCGGIYTINADCQMNDGCTNQMALVQQVCKNTDGTMTIMDSWNELMQGSSSGCHIDSKGNATGLKPFSPRRPSICPRCNDPVYYHTADGSGLPCGNLTPIYQELVKSNNGNCEVQSASTTKAATVIKKK